MVTPQGVLAQVPILETPYGYSVAMFSWPEEGCATLLGLILLPCHHQPGEDIYCVNQPKRILEIQDLDPSVNTIKWKNIYILSRAPPASSLTLARDIRISDGVALESPFRFGHAENFLRQHKEYSLISYSSRQYETNDTSTTTLVLQKQTLTMNEPLYLVLNLGVCAGSIFSPNHHGTRSHFAHVDIGPRRTSGLDSYPMQHDCDEDHIRDWPLYTKTFSYLQENHSEEIQLAFTPCALNPSNTLILHLLIDSSQSPYLELQPGMAERERDEVLHAIHIFRHIALNHEADENQQMGGHLGPLNSGIEKVVWSVRLWTLRERALVNTPFSAQTAGGYYYSPPSRDMARTTLRRIF